MKIYSSRVDSVHSETYKVLSNLSRADGGNDDDDDDGAELTGNASPSPLPSVLRSWDGGAQLLC